MRSGWRKFSCASLAAKRNEPLRAVEDLEYWPLAGEFPLRNCRSVFSKWFPLLQHQRCIEKGSPFQERTPRPCVKPLYAALPERQVVQAMKADKSSHSKN